MTLQLPLFVEFTPCPRCHRFILEVERYEDGCIWDANQTLVDEFDAAHEAAFTDRMQKAKEAHE